MDDASLLKSLGEIAGVGGLALGVFLLLFRKLELPRATRKHVTLFMWLVWSVAVLGLTAYLLSIYLSRQQIPAEGVVETNVGVIASDDSRVVEKYGSLLELYYTYYNYAENTKGDISEITPDHAYIQSFLNDSVFSAIDLAYYEAPLFNSPGPTLDVRLINNSAHTVTVQELILDIAESKSDPRPLPVFLAPSDLFAAMLVVDEGASNIDSLDLHFGFAPKGEGLTYPHSISIREFESGISELDFTDALVAEGFDVALLMELWDANTFWEEGEEVACSEYLQAQPAVPDRSAYVATTDSAETNSTCSAKYGLPVFGDFTAVGTLSGVDYSLQGKLESAIGFLPPDGLGGGLEVTDAFDVELSANRSNYSLRIPVSAYIRPQEADRFLIRMEGSVSGWHNFTVRPLLSDNSGSKSQPISLYYFYPKTSKRQAQQILDDLRQ